MMNNDRNIMLDLQELWNTVMKLESEIERSRRSIKLWENRTRELENDTAKTDSEYKNINLKIKQDELELTAIESRIEKTESRRNMLTSQKEVDALDSELSKLRNDRDILETSVFTMMEKADAVKVKLDSFREELDESKVQTAKDIEGLNKKILTLTDESETNRKRFDELKESLSPAVKSRFVKLINSKDGVAISKLNGEICTHCNFLVPSSVASALQKDSYSTCTNCGRFLYQA